MQDTAYDVLGIGNAIVDVLAHVDDAFLDRHRLDKGAMMLIDAERAESLYAALPPGIEISGGSAANTMVGIAGLGGRAAYTGKIRDDQLGQIFAHDIGAVGVRFATERAREGPPTARCLIAVTPDAQRTMSTYLGACIELSPDDVDEAAVAGAHVTYLEGYLWDPPGAKAAFRKAVGIAHRAGRKVALSLSDSFCVERHHGEFLDLVANHVDILFANEEEAKALFGVDQIDAAVAAARAACAQGAITRSAAGSLVFDGDRCAAVSAERLGPLVDSTGAGDLYAAGFLHGLTQGRDVIESGRIASLVAGEIVTHIGARPERDLAALVARRLA